jgi:hypothetical protein
VRGFLSPHGRHATNRFPMERGEDRHRLGMSMHGMAHGRETISTACRSANRDGILKRFENMFDDIVVHQFSHQNVESFELTAECFLGSE